ncbi:MAG TPA: hypothetical protein ENJ45_03380, partial [Phaeodactylibacter sp.]|nr:hypothetical protein [Phaeodactylibacter sp.]
MNRVFTLILVLVLALWSCHPREDGFEQIHAPFLQANTAWADSMLLEMTLDEKIGQLLILQSRQYFPTDSLAHWVWTGNMGGYMPEGISLIDYVHLKDSLQSIARIPLMMGTAQTIALNNQFSDAPHYPLPITLSAIPSRKKKTAILEQYVQQCKTLDIHFSLHPYMHRADTTDTPYDIYALENDPEELLFQSYVAMRTLQDEKVLSIAGPFRELYFADPEDKEAQSRRDSLLRPYYSLSQSGLSGILIDNALFSQDTNRFYPYGFLRDYLRKHASFDALLFAKLDTNVTALDLLHAGADLLLIQDSPSHILQQIRKLVKDGFLSVEQINTKVRKVLLAKDWLDIDQKPFGKSCTDDAFALFDKEKHRFPIYDLYASSTTLANNMDSLIPFQDLAQHSFRLLHFGNASMRPFQKTFAKYAYSRIALKHYDLSEKEPSDKLPSGKNWKNKTLVITLAN